MNIELATVSGFEIRQNQNSGRDVVMLQVYISDKTDTYSAQLFCGIGNNYIPPIDSTVLLVSINANFKIAIASDDGLDPLDSEEGEKVIYSSDDDGVRRAQITLAQEGNLELDSIDNNEVVQSSLLLDNSGNVILDSSKILIGSSSSDEALIKGTTFISDLNTFITALGVLAAALVVPTGVPDAGTKTTFASAVTTFQTALSNALSEKGFTE